MSIEKRRNGYCVRWRDSAGRACSKQVTLWRDAVALDGEMKRKKAMGELITHEKGTIRLCDFYDIYAANHGRVHLSPRTSAVYSTLFSKHISKRIGSLPLRTLSREHVATLSAQLSRTLAPSSVRKTLAVLQSVLERAVEWGYIPMNPAKGVRKPRLVQREGRALSPTDVEAICLELDLRSQTIVRVLAGTGLRPGELRALTWADVRAQALRGVSGSITVNKAVSNNELGPTKTRSRRTVELRREVDHTFREWALATGLRINDIAMRALVFPGRGGRVWTDQGWRMWQRQVFKPAAERAGLAGVVPYDLRHTFASTLIAEGRDIYWVARQLGHSPTMTLSTYGHLFESVYSERTANVDEARIPRARRGN